MKKTVLIFLCLTAVGTAFGQEEFLHPHFYRDAPPTETCGKRSSFHVSFVPPLSTHGSRAALYTNGASFNILAGLSKNEESFTLGGVTNVILENARGFQAAGVSNHIGNDGSGFLLGGVLNTVGNDYRGFQMAGLANRTGNHFSGMQLAGLLNIGGDTKGVQIAGVGNIAREANRWQFAGLFNSATEVRGAQIAGLVNVAGRVRGVQFAGLLNIAEESDYPIGIVNLVRNGQKSIGITYNETGSTVLSFRSGGRVLYGILGAGINHRSSDHRMVFEAGLGGRIRLSERFQIDNEVSANLLTEFKGSRANQYTFAVLPSYRFAGRMEIFAGPGINYMESNDPGSTKIFPHHHLWKKYGESRSKQLYLGYTAGTRFVF